MSDEKPKPFAEVFGPDGHDEAFSAHAGSIVLAYGGRVQVTERAEQINAAVEAREAQLKGAVVDLIQRHRQQWEDDSGAPDDLAVPRWREMIGEVKRLQPDSDFIAGDLACGYAFVFGQHIGAIESLNALLTDAQAALTSDRERDLLVPFLRARGHAEAKPPPCAVHPYTTQGEIKTIGLFPREGQTDFEAYAEWSRKLGKVCACGLDDGARVNVEAPTATREPRVPPYINPAASRVEPDGSLTVSAPQLPPFINPRRSR